MVGEPKEKHCECFPCRNDGSDSNNDGASKLPSFS